jgi:hypothetical protein
MSSLGRSCRAEVKVARIGQAADGTPVALERLEHEHVPVVRCHEPPRLRDSCPGWVVRLSLERSAKRERLREAGNPSFTFDTPALRGDCAGKVSGEKERLLVQVGCGERLS